MSFYLFSILVGTDMINNHSIKLPRFSVIALKLFCAEVKNLQICHKKFHYFRMVTLGIVWHNFGKILWSLDIFLLKTVEKLEI